MDNKQEKRKREKKKEITFSDTISSMGCCIRDTITDAFYCFENNFYPFKESLIDIYDKYFCENNQNISGNISYFTIISDQT